MRIVYHASIPATVPMPKARGRWADIPSYVVFVWMNLTMIAARLSLKSAQLNQRHWFEYPGCRITARHTIQMCGSWWHK